MTADRYSISSQHRNCRFFIENAEVVICFNESRIDLDRFAIMALRFDSIADLLECDGYIIVDLPIVEVYLKSFVIDCECILILFQPIKDVAEIIVCCYIVRLQFKSLLKVVFGIFQIAHQLVSIAQIIVNI